ncbi:methionyl-tRNA formyltransferase [Amphibacillus sp. MSJ-3]|uniref:methionyl-tRNA formyltransferase n=1 Tax=Amphibacillus sp. MSJ-3 TaxID=2841505 RepID=UPI001C0EA1CF|nr:methionyl-tRNA formyltransferase [Amphibacillus sp. MSJ-3]MBU5594608.1 methionyl-tRNA formyltransferase [Amphibacillus sp. MSJ-3]
MKKIVFMGTPDFSVPILQQIIKDGYEVVLVVTQPDRPKGRKRTLTAPPVKVEALKHNLTVFQPEKIRDSYQEIVKYEPDLIVTAAFGQILPKELLDAPTYGCINVHASLLPELRGGAPIHYAIMQGKKETGITIMYMVEALDAGAILSQVTVPIENEDHVGILHDKLSEAGAQLLKQTLPRIFDQSIQAVEQDDMEATYAPNITREQEKIDWTNSAEAIYNQIRGLHPWPVASTSIGGKNLKIWWAEIASISQSACPGEIVDITDDALIIACGQESAIRVLDIQLSGKKRMSVKDFLNGSGDLFKVGQRLGLNHE